jgi:hypothetical protein
MLGACSSHFFDLTLNVDPPPYIKQLVVHTFMNNGDTALVCQVTRNTGLLTSATDQDLYITDATVQLLEDGKLKATLQPVTGQNSLSLYSTPAGNGFFQSGKTYELKVQHADFPNVSAMQTMPSPCTVDSVRFRKDGGISTDGEHLFALDAYLKDAPGVKNYYSIAAKAYYDQVYPKYDQNGNVIGYDTFTYDAGRIFPETDDPNVTLAGSQIVVTDQFFDGKSYKLSFKSYQNSYTKFRVYVHSITQDYYLYLLSAQQKSDAADSPISEPVTVYTNLNGGIGIFGMYWVQEFKIN